MVEDTEPLPEEDAVPIINVGGLEPVFSPSGRRTRSSVDEEVDETPSRGEEAPKRQEAAIEDERPANLVNFSDQELYEENPAWRFSKGRPRFLRRSPAGMVSAAPPSATAPWAATASPYAPPPAPAPYAPPPRMRLHLHLPLCARLVRRPRRQRPLRRILVRARPGPQGESVLANSLKESVAAQIWVVDQLFEEMKELSRRIDQKNAPQPQPLPPIVVNQQPGAPQGAPQRPDHHGPPRRAAGGGPSPVRGQRRFRRGRDAAAAIWGSGSLSVNGPRPGQPRGGSSVGTGSCGTDGRGLGCRWGSAWRCPRADAGGRRGGGVSSSSKASLAAYRGRPSTGCAPGRSMMIGR